LFEVARRLARSGRDGTTRFWRVLNRRPAWAKPAESHHEVTLLGALRARGLVLERQVAVTLPTGDVVHLDAGDPARQFGVEVDHVTWHGGRADVDYDKWRTRQLSIIGWTVPRVTDTDIERRLAATVADLITIHDGCRPRAGAMPREAG
jgi:very-short-patch-repair endonuclease